MATKFKPQTAYLINDNISVRIKTTPKSKGTIEEAIARHQKIDPRLRQVTLKEYMAFNRRRGND